MDINGYIPLKDLLAIPFTRLMRYSLLLETAVNNFNKDNNLDASASIEIALQHSRDVSVYADDIMLAGRIGGFTVK